MSIVEGKHKYHKVGNTGSDLSCWFRLENLDPSSAYYVMITAENEHGEGYRPEIPSMVLT
jgi:hypothetical protein